MCNNNSCGVSPQCSPYTREHRSSVSSAYASKSLVKRRRAMYHLVGCQLFHRKIISSRVRVHVFKRNRPPHANAETHISPILIDRNA